MIGMVLYKHFQTKIIMSVIELTGSDSCTNKEQFAAAAAPLFG